MTAEKSTDWLIDLLYADEDEDMLDSTEGDLPTDQREELEGMRDMLSEIRQAWPPMESPSASLREGLLAQAREAAAAAAETEAQGARMPRATRSPAGSIWSRVRARTLVQITGVAVVLLTGSFFLGQMAQEPGGASAPSMELARTDTAPSPAPEIAANDFPVKAAEKNDDIQAAPPIEQSKTLAYKDEAKPQEEEARPAPAVAKPEPQKARKATRSKKKESVRFGDDTLLKQARRPAKKSPYRAPAIIPSAPSSSAGPFGQEGPTVAEYDTQDALKEARSKRSSARTRSASTSNQMPERLQNATKPADEAAPAAEPPAPVAPPPKADPAPKKVTSKLEAAADKNAAAPTPTVAGIERASRAAQHDRTIAEADRFLRQNLGSVADRVRVMELKAKAHTAKGENAQADALLNKIAEQYPEQAKKKKVRKRKSKAKSRPMKRMKLDSMEAF